MAGRYFEDFTVGEKFITPARTITETDVVIFSGLSGDYNPLHTDEEFGKKTRFGRRIAHGALGIAVMTGLVSRLGLSDGTVIAVMDIKWAFHAPLFIGDTVHGEVTVASLEPTRKPDRGMLLRETVLVNQKGERLQSGSMRLMVRRKLSSVSSD
jgi:acyl dehydratase